MGEFLAELGVELLGELLEGSIGVFLHSKKVKRWVKTLVMAILAVLPVGILGAVTFGVWRRGGKTAEIALLGLLTAAAAVLFIGAVVRGHRRNWVPKEKKGFGRRKRYEP